MSRVQLPFTAILLLCASSAAAGDRPQARSPAYGQAPGWSDPGVASYARPDQQFGTSVFSTYAPVYRTPGPNTYTYPHGTTVWYGTSVIPVSPVPQPVLTPASPFANAASPAPVVIHVHHGRGRRH